MSGEMSDPKPGNFLVRAKQHHWMQVARVRRHGRATVQGEQDPLENVSSIDAGRSALQSGDSGLIAFTLLSRVLGVAADPAQLRHQFVQGAEQFGVSTMLRAAKQLGLKARLVSTSWERLAATALPAIAVLRDGRFMLLGRQSADQVLIHDPVSNRPLSMSKDDFVASWSGELIRADRDPARARCRS